MQYWLMKSEPNVWSLDQQEKSGAKGATWDGVRNFQAANNLKKMRNFHEQNSRKMTLSCIFKTRNIILSMLRAPECISDAHSWTEHILLSAKLAILNFSSLKISTS